MDRQPQQASGSGFAGFYLRLGGQARFWGWGVPPLETEVRLRAELPELPYASLTAKVHSAGHDTGKPTVRFACDRHFLGLVVR